MTTKYRLISCLLFSILLWRPSLSLAQEQATLRTSQVAATATVILTKEQVATVKSISITVLSGAKSPSLSINGKVCAGTLAGQVLTVIPPDGALVVGSNKYSLSYTLPVAITMPLSLSLTPAPIPVPTPTPTPPMATGETPTPRNLRIVSSVWDDAGKVSIDTLAWDAVPGAVFYKIYAYRYLIGTASTPTFTVPKDKAYNQSTYTVTAIVDGEESIPSVLSLFGTGFGPGGMGWDGRQVPPSVNLTCATVWDNPTTAQNVITWGNGEYQGMQLANTFRVYRDGVLICAGISRLYYIDTNIVPGKTYKYEIEGEGLYHDAVTVGAKVPLSVAVPAKPPAFYLFAGTVPPLTGIQAKPNDDSVIVTIPKGSAVVGAQDYRVYVKGKSSYKYAGLPLKRYPDNALLDVDVEYNNFDPAGTPYTLVVEAIDRQGPFMTMDGVMPSGHMEGMATHTNGQGDPSNRPVVLARSEVTVSQFVPFKTTGSQVFLDTFRGDPTITLVSNDTTKRIQTYRSEKWRIKTWEADAANTVPFIMSRHFMDTLYDGDTVGPVKGSGPAHNNIASLTMEPITPTGTAFADISGGKTLRVFMEVDAHFNSRRWCDIGLFSAGDILIDPAFQKLKNGGSVTQSGDALIWQIMGEVYGLDLLRGNGTNDGKLARQQPQMQMMWQDDPVLGTGREWFVARNAENENLPYDRRYLFELYVSETNFALVFDGKVIASRPLTEKLPFTKITPYFSHHVYHTGNDYIDARLFQQGRGQYFYNHRPYADLRHWDSMGFEVLDKFPFGLVNPLVKAAQ